MSYTALLVALSRTTSSNGIRILPLHPHGSIDYLNNLQPDLDLKVWFSGFNADGVWNAKNCSNISDITDKTVKSTKKQISTNRKSETTSTKTSLSLKRKRSTKELPLRKKSKVAIAPFLLLNEEEIFNANQL